MATTTAQRKSMAVPLTAFTAGAVVAVLVGVFGRVHDPTLDGTTSLVFGTVIEMKVAVATEIAILLVFQVVSALWIYGRFGVPAPRWLGPAHRISGTLALLGSVFVAYHCLWTLGLQVGSQPDGSTVGTRTVVHGLLGCAVIGAIVVKVTAVRSRRAPGWFLPVAGGLLFSLIVLTVLTSAGWYLTAQGWPHRVG